jgi:hypothetical protein
MDAFGRGRVDVEKRVRSRSRLGALPQDGSQRGGAKR